MKLGLSLVYAPDFSETEAAAAVPVELARGMSLIGPEEYPKERVDAYAAAGVTCLLASPVANTHAERVDQIATVRGLAGKGEN
jgi:hypothetical protein